MNAIRRISIITLTIVIALGLSSMAVFAASSAKSVKLNKKSITLQMGKTYKLKATVKPKGASKVTWKSSNKKVAKVNKKGKVTPVKPGKAKITVKTKNGKKATCTVKVVKGNQKAPAAPKLEARDAYSIELVEEDDCEYMISGGKWTDDPYFETDVKGAELKPDTSYTFYQRLAGDNKWKPSPSSKAATFKTDKSDNQKLYDQLVAAGVVKNTGIEMVPATSDEDEYVLLKQNFTIPSGTAITVGEDASLYISGTNVLTTNNGANNVNNASLTNSGYIYLCNNSSISANIAQANGSFIDDHGTIALDTARNNFSFAVQNSTRTEIYDETECRVNYTMKPYQEIYIDEEGGLYLGYGNGNSAYILTVPKGAKIINNGWLGGDSINKIHIANAGTTGGIVEGTGTIYAASASNIEWAWNNENGRQWDDVIIGDATFVIPAAGFTIPAGKSITTEASDPVGGSVAGVIQTNNSSGNFIVKGYINNEGYIGVLDMTNRPTDNFLKKYVGDGGIEIGAVANYEWALGLTDHVKLTPNTSIALSANLTVPAGTTLEVNYYNDNNTLNLGAYTLTINGTLNLNNNDSRSTISASTGGKIVVGKLGTLNQGVNSRISNANLEITGVEGATYNVLSSVTATDTKSIFYPAGSETAATAVPGTIYKWTADAGGTGVAGWKAQ